jgi:ATP-binding cassette subfamily B protein
MPSRRLPETGAAKVLLRCLGYLRPYWLMTLGGYLALIGINGLTLAIPQFIRWIIDNGIGHNDTALVKRAVIGLIVMALARGVLSYLQGRWTETASQSVACDLRSAIHRQLARLSFSYHDRSETGQLLSRAIQDVERIRFITGRAFVRIADGIVLLLGTSVMLLYMNPLLAVLALATMPVIIWRAIFLGSRQRPLALLVQKQLAKVTTRLEQNLRGTRIVKAFAQEDAEISRFARENNRWLSLSSRSAKLQAVHAPMISLIANMGTVIVIGVGGWLVCNNRLTLGELVAFTTCIGLLIIPVRRLGNIISALALAVSAGERIFEILDVISEVRDTVDARPLPAVNGEVRFEEVIFAYTHGHRILRGVSFVAAPGQIIAIMGTTGSGKSTIINLIPRFYDPVEGRILIDGHDIRQVTLASLRDQIGIVLQETTLFATTIRENLLFGRPNAGEAEMIAAATAARAHEFICRMPQGYDTQVGEGGVTLSGGQKQRLAIARTLLRDPRILILDDATASVDTETEQLIQKALDKLMAGRTCFVIAQRLSTLRKADLIIILYHGRVVAQGTHAELIGTSGLYADLYQQQAKVNAT